MTASTTPANQKCSRRKQTTNIGRKQPPYRTRPGRRSASIPDSQSRRGLESPVPLKSTRNVWARPDVPPGPLITTRNQRTLSTAPTGTRLTEQRLRLQARLACKPGGCARQRRKGAKPVSRSWARAAGSACRHGPRAVRKKPDHRLRETRPQPSLGHPSSSQESGEPFSSRSATKMLLQMLPSAHNYLFVPNLASGTHIATRAKRRLTFRAQYHRCEWLLIWCSFAALSSQPW